MGKVDKSREGVPWAAVVAELEADRQRQAAAEKKRKAAARKSNAARRKKREEALDRAAEAHAVQDGDAGDAGDDGDQDGGGE